MFLIYVFTLLAASPALRYVHNILQKYINPGSTDRLSIDLYWMLATIGKLFEYDSKVIKEFSILTVCIEEQ